MSALENLILSYPQLEQCRNDMENTFSALKMCFEKNGRLYICGNGGSASDALHIVGELVKSFVYKRELDESFIARMPADELEKYQGALPAFALVENTALVSAYANDVDAEYVFAQQVYAYAREGDCVLGISTSGNSKNILRALEAAHGRGAVTLGLTGRDGGVMKSLCKSCIVVPAQETYKIQELHLPVYHALCMMLEEHFWNK